MHCVGNGQLEPKRSPDVIHGSWKTRGGSICLCLGDGVWGMMYHCEMSQFQGNRFKPPVFGGRTQAIYGIKLAYSYGSTSPAFLVARHRSSWQKITFSVGNTLRSRFQLGFVIGSRWDSHAESLGIALGRTAWGTTHDCDKASGRRGWSLADNTSMNYDLL